MSRRFGAPGYALSAVLLLGVALLGAAPAAAQAGPSPEPSIPAPVCTPEVEPNDRPEEAPQLSSAICLTGTLPRLRDQDIVLWTVEPIEDLITWRVTVVGIATTITSVHIFAIDSAPDAPLDVRNLDRVDSSATDREPGVKTGLVLPAGRYLLGISRGDPVGTVPPPPDEYQIMFEREEYLPPTGDIEPNDDPAAATPLGNPIDLTGDVKDGTDLYRWTVTPDEASRRWQVDVRAVEGDYMELELQDESGNVIQRTDVARDGDGHFHDLQLAAGSYLLAFTTTDDDPTPYVLTSTASDAEDTDPEPNDQRTQALPISVGEELPGRLAGPRDIDEYALSVPLYEVATLLDVGITVGSEQDRQVCLVSQADQVEVQCRQGRGDIVLSNLSLQAGDYFVQVSGDEDVDDRYRLAVAEAGMIVADREVEPNDDPATASAFDPTLVLNGRSANDDADFLRITVTGEPQVWRLDATGTGIEQLLWLEPDLEVRGTGEIAADGQRASVWDMALVPGDHWISIKAAGEDYQLAMTPLGPRAAGAEREPNNDSNNAEPIEIDSPRTGRLPGPTDTDVYRFSLEAPEQVTINLEPPADGAARLRVLSGGLELLRVREPRDGVPITWQAFLPEGDVELYLQSDSGSVQPYTLSVLRGDRFAHITDLEPNDALALARPIPSDLVIEGTGYGAESGEDRDWYLLPPLESESAIEVTADGEVTGFELNDGTGGVRFAANDDGTWVSSPVPAGTELRLSVHSSGPYTVQVSSEGLTPEAVPAPLPVEAQLSAAIADVAAYATVGQRVDGTLQLTNTGSTALSLDLEAVTSHYAWSIEPSVTTLDLAAGASQQVPVTIHVGDDAWADIPVRFSVRVSDGTGRGVTASTDVTARRDQPLVAPEPWWPVPTSMRGGLDAASLALGATVPAPVNNSELQLHDGVAVMSVGFSGNVSGEPQALTVDLATDDAVPVAGFVIDPLAGSPTLATAPRSFELLLSDDGTTWEPGLEGELSPVGRAQPFPLPETLDARFAQLRIASTWAGPTGAYWLGEWQVIATPGWTPVTELNVADPVNGGHIAWMQPGATDPRQLDSMLSETIESSPWEPYLQQKQPVSWALAFHEERAPQLTRLEWVDAPGSDPAMRFDQLKVQVGTESALGPWQEVGTWVLERAADGSVTPFTFPEPTWARFVRFEGAGPDVTSYWEMPVVIRAYERPTDADYQSIVGAWGRGNPTAVHELLVPPDTSAMEQPLDLTDGNDTAETATVVAPEAEPLDARIRRGQDVDWYSFTVPDGLNRLAFTLGAGAEAGLEPTLYDSAGTALELVSISSGARGGRSWGAKVEPGATYRLRVEQLPFSTVITYDTSGSMGTYLSYVSAALRGFAADITPDEEAVMVIPFEDSSLLDHWSDDPFEIESAVAGVASVSGSSAAERALQNAARELGFRKGPKAILLVTDAETSSYPDNGALWGWFDDVHPIVFAVHVEGGGAPALTTDLMQDWAWSGGGHYDYAWSHGQVDRAFDRLATWLRRPAAYTVSWGASFESDEPGTLSISPPPGPQGSESVVAGSGVAVEVLLDTSGSMLEKLGGQRRIDVAKTVLRRLVNETLPQGVPLAFRTFKAGVDSCDSELLAPLAPLDPARMTELVKDLRINKRTRTPIAATLRQVAADLGQGEGPRIIVLITDGEESCGGKPAAAIKDLVAAGLDVRVNIVGFDIDDKKLKRNLERWAEMGHGQSFDANSAEGLALGIAEALRAPFRVFDEDGVEVATGIVGGPDLQLPPGTYRVEVLTDPVIVLEDVVIVAGEGRDIELEVPAPSQATP